MNGFKKYYIGYIVGILLSIAAGVTVGLLVDFTALQSIRVFLISSWVIAGIAAVTALVLGVYNIYNYNTALAKQLKNHIMLLVTGIAATLIFTAITALLIDMGTLTLAALKILTAFGVLSIGLVITAAFSFIYWLIKKASFTVEQ